MTTSNKFTMRQLLEAGVHYGHTTRRRNPKMDRYIFGVRNGINIINLEHTYPLLHTALKALKEVAAAGGRILFVGTKMQAAPIIAEAAERSGQYYVNHRWLGGMLTNWKTISNSIKKLRDTETFLQSEDALNMTKKERLELQREMGKLTLSLGGIKEMGGIPDALFVIDVMKEAISIQEAQKLGIPVIGILDSNASPEGVDYPIPGNDDATKAIQLYCDLAVESILDGIRAEMATGGVDLGAEENPNATPRSRSPKNQRSRAAKPAKSSQEGEEIAVLENVVAE
jgi:small subunit ribosomal protein S2